ncbi:MAG TPA: hypothetical protein VLT47_09555 [Anaeromyxobacteraceae bacterium]|nr:hypothetical protein [Anaeromyxobacteraceae bacterium]
MDDLLDVDGPALEGLAALLEEVVLVVDRLHALDGVVEAALGDLPHGWAGWLGILRGRRGLRALRESRVKLALDVGEAASLGGILEAA